MMPEIAKQAAKRLAIRPGHKFNNLNWMTIAIQSWGSRDL